MKLSFTCDARVTLDIEAESLSDAMEQWESFCVGMANSDSFCANRAGVPDFFILLTDSDDNPEIETEDGWDVREHAGDCPHRQGGECDCHRCILSE